MERSAFQKGRAHIGWIILVFVLFADAGLALWLWLGHQERNNYDNNRLDLPVAPKPDALPAARPVPSAPTVNPLPATPLPQPAKPATFPLRVQERPEWGQAAASFVHVAGMSKYRRSPVLRSWAQDFVAYPDLRAIGLKYARDRDLLYFTVAVLRSTNFAKMLRKYGPSPDVKGFFTDLMSAPGVAQSSRALFDDPNIRYSIKDLTIPGMPSLGQLMANGSQNPKMQIDDASLRKFMEEQQRRAAAGAQ